MIPQNSAIETSIKTSGSSLGPKRRFRMSLVTSALNWSVAISWTTISSFHTCLAVVQPTTPRRPPCERLPSMIPRAYRSINFQARHSLESSYDGFTPFISRGSIGASPVRVSSTPTATTASSTAICHSKKFSSPMSKGIFISLTWGAPSMLA